MSRSMGVRNKQWRQRLIQMCCLVLRWYFLNKNRKNPQVYFIYLCPQPKYICLFWHIFCIGDRTSIISRMVMQGIDLSCTDRFRLIQCWCEHEVLTLYYIAINEIPEFIHHSWINQFCCLIMEISITYVLGLRQYRKMSSLAWTRFENKGVQQ